MATAEELALIFQSTPSVGRATKQIVALVLNTTISIHALRGEGDETETEITQVWTISIHALRGEGDKVKAAFRISSFISIHALRGEGDWLRPLLKLALIISIHALRGEGDAAKVYTESLTKNFNPRPPWGGRQRHKLFCSLCRNFNPRPPWGGRLLLALLAELLPLFQSTPSVGRATTMFRKSLRKPSISIHALRGEGDEVSFHFERMSLKFQSTPSVGRATIKWQQRKSLHLYFNPRPPWGGRLHWNLMSFYYLRFQSTPSVGRATGADGKNRRISRHFNPRPPWGGRPSAGIEFVESKYLISIHALRGEGDNTS